ncbi:MAG TPA: hypothetical protein VMN39_00930 [Longimicrobiaceae bacterium]|nr:hypothetical protein [Longimicrobiaceae bacterium]
MSRLFTDDSLMTWEAFASGGPFGLPDSPMIVFNCLSEPGLRGRFVQHEGDETDAQRIVRELSEDELNRLLESARELE